ncbi:hypothetical protein [Flavobacterium aciduliphilum]|uniref:Lipoprotein n=1 Tax=Flavobacterium aciduliphilum TaxID=1101402 RepID=A0A328YBV5_9FLAO|nr:hypothetical protein [Flavobacterium aciduliphilum]RAR71458.1 hypothetical protein CLV55_10713 [Flavobacterium aciduliphilum]
MKTKIVTLAILLSLFVVSCSKNDTSETSYMSKDEAQASSKIDLASDDVSTIVEDQYNNINSNSFSNKNGVVALSTCATITRVPAFGTVLNDGDLVTKTIDFGSGCTLANNNVVSGKIIITFTYHPTATSQTVNYSFDNFYHNNIKIEGNKSFTRTMTTGANPHPIVIMQMDLTATINGQTHHRVGSRTREIIAGYDTPNDLSDNVYSITGSWTTTHPSGTITSTITTPLQVKMSCMNVHKPLIVSGVITFTKNNHTATLDYGTGDCDNTAVFTINGNSYTIVIGN